MTQSNFGFDPIHKKTRKEVFLEEMNRVLPWAALVALIQPHAPDAPLPQERSIAWRIAASGQVPATPRVLTDAEIGTARLCALAHCSEQDKCAIGGPLAA